MELTASQRKTIQHQFDSFCKKVLRDEARDYIRSLKRLAEREISFHALSETQAAQLSQSDDYPSEHTVFIVQGESIRVKNARLADALAALPAEKREIVLLAYFLDMSDREIAEQLNLVRSTVQYKRTSSLAEIKGRMGG